MAEIYKFRSEGSLAQKLSPQSLLRFAANTFSECGQDGILQQIFSKCGIQTGLFVEFGAWDGAHLSNCRALSLRGWKGVSIECVPERFETLKKNAPESLIAINAMVGTSSGKVSGESLTSLLKKHGVNTAHVTFVSIDIDGSDLEVFEDLEFKPPVILVEGGFNYNPSITSKIDFEYAAKNNQHPVGAVVSSAKSHGYEAVCFFQDTYLVRKDLAHHFEKQIELGATGLYKDAWAFASDTLREYLLKFRDADKHLQKFEERALGSFDKNPVAGL